MAFQTQTQKSSVLATQFPKSQPCPGGSSKSQIAARYAVFGTQSPKSHWPLSFSAPKSQRFKSQRLQDANATKSQTLAFYKNRSVLVPLSLHCTVASPSLLPNSICSETIMELIRFRRGPRATHHPHKRPSPSGGIFGGVVCELSEPKEKKKYAPPPFLHSRC